MEKCASRLGSKKLFKLCVVLCFVENKMINQTKNTKLKKTDHLDNVSPAIVAVSNLFFLSNPLFIWPHMIDAVFRDELDEQHQIIKEELTELLVAVKAEFDLHSTSYKDIMPVTFESKVRLVLAVFRVSVSTQTKSN